MSEEQTPPPDTATPFGELTTATGTATFTIAEACALFGVSDSTVRRGIREGRIEATQRTTERGPAWAITEAAMTAAGFTKVALNAPERTEVATANLEAEQERLAKVQAEHALEVARMRADFLERENARLTEEVTEVRENLRKALDRIPLALPPAPPAKGLRRLFKRKSTPPTTPPSA
jgi:DNA-binding transcriptional MerR regulator